MSEASGHGREPLIAEPPSWMPKVFVTMGIKPVVVLVTGAVLGLVTTIALGGWVYKNVMYGDGVQEKMLLINQAKLDHRQYQWAKMSNDLEVVTVQDAASTSSGFAVAVQAGSFYDPKELQGLAHFCEHMLFLGTQKYPNPSGFDQFLNMHGGANNAYTAEEVTVYFAQLDNAGFTDGLDRFADFFRAPLFDETYVKREVHAIDSEHAKNKQSPDWRILQVMQSLADPRSPVAGFHTGDIKTLYDEPMAKGINPVDGLKTYYAENYCTPKMRLVTFGPKPVDDQLKEAVSKFGDIQQRPECQGVPTSFAEPKPYPPDRLQKWVHIGGTQPQPQLWIFFSMPDVTKQYKAHPMRYLKYVLGYSGVDSLSETLKTKLGLTTGLDVAADMSSAGSAFWIVATLTPKGAQYPDVVLNELYSYIAQMNKKGVDQNLYQSLAALTKVEWEWSEESDTIATVQSMAEQMTRLPKEDLLTGDYLITQTDASLIQNLMKKLEPSSMNVAFVDPNFQEGDGTLELPHYGVKYTVEELGSRMLVSKEWAGWVTGTVSEKDIQSAVLRNLQAMDASITAAPLIKHPDPIQHIPGKITLDYAQAPPGSDEISVLFGAEPKQQDTSSKTDQVWYRQGSTSQSPKVHVKFLARTNSHNPISGDDVMIHSVWRRMLQEQLHPKLVDLAATGSWYDLEVGAHSLSVSFSGFNENMPAMMQMVTQEIQKGVDITQMERFNRVKESLKEELEDKSEMPVQYAIQDRSILLMQGTHSDQQLKSSLQYVKPEMLTNPPVAGLDASPVQFTSLTMGNIDKATALTQAESFKSMMKYNLTVQPGEVELLTPVLHPKVPLELRKLNPRAHDPNHVTVISVLAGVPDVIDSVIWSIIGQVLGPVAYDELRTRKQLGYVVSGGVGKMSNVLVLSVVVQGKEMMPDETEALIDMVLTKLMPDRLVSMTDEEFESYKEATAKAFLKPPLGFSDEVSNYWPSVAAMGQCFEKRRDELEYLQNQLKSKKQLLDAYNNVIMPQRGVRSRVVVKYWSQDVEGGIPARPGLEDKKKMMETAGVSSQGIKQHEKEYKETRILTAANSNERNKLMDEFGHFSEELKCRSPAAQKVAEEPQSEENAEQRVAPEETNEDAEIDSARVAVHTVSSGDGSSQVQLDQAAIKVHDRSEGIKEVAREEDVAAYAVGASKSARRKKRTDSAVTIDHGAQLSVDETPDSVLRAED